MRNFPVDEENHPSPTNRQLFDRFIELKGNIEEFAYPAIVTPQAVTYITARKVGETIQFDSKILKFPSNGGLTDEIIGIIGKVNFTARTLSVLGIPNEQD